MAGFVAWTSATMPSSALRMPWLASRVMPDKGIRHSCPSARRRKGRACSSAFGHKNPPWVGVRLGCVRSHQPSTGEYSA
jgi:hypothetical protein